MEQYPDVTYHFITMDMYWKYQDLAEDSPNTKGAKHWKREFMQKESIKDVLTHLQDDDLVFIGDVDEIVAPSVIESVRGNLVAPSKLELKVYTYYLNNRSTEGFYGTLMGSWGAIKGKCLNHLRSSNEYTFGDCGWHFTSMGGVSALKHKLTDSYTYESYATDRVLNALEANYGEKDFLGRNFTYTVDESEWPDYLKGNREKYQHLCRLPKNNE